MLRHVSFRATRHTNPVAAKDCDPLASELPDHGQPVTARGKHEAVYRKAAVHTQYMLTASPGTSQVTWLSPTPQLAAHGQGGQAPVQSGADSDRYSEASSACPPPLLMCVVPHRPHVVLVMRRGDATSRKSSTSTVRRWQLGAGACARGPPQRCAPHLHGNQFLCEFLAALPNFGAARL